MNTTTGRTQTNRERQWRILAQIAVLVLIAAACGSSEGDASTTFSSDDALSVTDAYFEEFNTGDVDAVLSLFSPDATIDSGFGGRYTRTEFEMITAYYTAQGTTLTPPECTVTDEVPGEAITVFCAYGTHDAPSQAVSAPPVHTKFTMVVTPDGIRQLAFTYGPLDFLHINNPFYRWIMRNRPEDAETTEYGNWTTVDEARQNAILRAQYAAEWATYLTENDCTYLDGC